MKLCDREIKAVIFDLDGTLIDSTNIWKEIDKNFFKKRGMEVPKTYVDDIAHISLKEAAIYTKNTYGLKESIEEIIQEWMDASKEQYLYQIPLKANVKEYLAYLKSQGIILTVATAGEAELYIPCLKRLGILEYFDYIADVNIVQAGKDSVKLYHHISDKIGIAPENTAVFEDISVGLKTAFTNNYLSIAVYDEHSKKEDDLKRSYSYKFIYDFKELL